MNVILILPGPSYLKNLRTLMYNCFWLCHGLGGCLLASHDVGLGLMRGLSMWDSWYTGTGFL